eukprot:1161033-Pelagomonas_calceolata.AAC.8
MGFVLKARHGKKFWSRGLLARGGSCGGVWEEARVAVEQQARHMLVVVQVSAVVVGVAMEVVA